MQGWRIGGLRLWLPLCHHSVAENTHFILINEITPSAPRKVKGHEATCVRTCLFLLKKKKKKKVRNNTHPWKTLYCFTAQTVSNKAYFTKTHTKVDIIDLHTSILVNFVQAQKWPFLKQLSVFFPHIFEVKRAGAASSANQVLAQMAESYFKRL